MMNKQHYTLTEVARTMNRNKATISREIKRKRGLSDRETVSQIQETRLCNTFVGLAAIKDESRALVMG